MKPYNEDRAHIEYARIHRVFTPDMFNAVESDFGGDLQETLTVGLTHRGRWWGHEWRLGDVAARHSVDGRIGSIFGRFGWFEEADTTDVPPPYDEKSHEWSDEPSRVRHGALGVFYVDTPSQLMSVTSAAGELSVRGFCRALEDLLNQAEMDYQHNAAGVRAPREWMVDQVDERGTFDAWLENVQVVNKVHALFHLPNPRVSDDIAPAVRLLRELKAERGELTASSANGLTPLESPLMRAAIEMQRHDYGSITAEGVTQNGEDSKYQSKEHPVRDRIEMTDIPVTRREMIGILAAALARRLERGLQ